ncbi:hypothetical protein ACM01_09955 [Streptomyces viridochromogenes]|uniref:Uncharacterized protein n=1 Tax=Streptomyces viridochromogenes TaxID=1938 RepID=A0A0J7ZIN5_STRVR|nr:hypothetical protein [Streptomyces viridochromogenes]KMS75307.1 hypothetical protein ACM01_09955 [Streptomyces viridochromogenes]KOG19482.1 hypothetical protein ADK36_19120 [Streptomyces viridochromogenes]KOG20972.1 hypothetical protein ADK35_17740 [Streptomyces viridochromogenes]
MSNDTVRTARASAKDFALGYDPGDSLRTRAFGVLVDRAAEAYGINMHYAGDDPDAAREAMEAGLASVSRGFAAAALEAVAQNETLALSLDQKLHLGELAGELDLETVEFLRGAC